MLETIIYFGYLFALVRAGGYVSQWLRETNRSFFPWGFSYALAVGVLLSAVDLIL
jgi:hypothetical protein